MRRSRPRPRRGTPDGRCGRPQSGCRPGGALALADDGVGLLADLAAAWRLVEVTGARLAARPARLAEAARTDEAVRREVAAQLAGPRATALLLALLPAAGVLLGTGLGADPVGSSSRPRRAGSACCGGRCWCRRGSWTEAIVARAEGR